MATPNYIDGAVGTTKGVASAETGIKIESVTTTVNNPRIETKNEDGATDGFVEGFDPSITIAVTGEVISTAGIAAAVFGTGQTIANEEDGSLTGVEGIFFGIDQTSGEFYLSGTPTVTSNRGELKTVSLEFTCYPLVSGTYA